MIFECVTVKRFKGLTDLQLHFHKGINVIKGPNEAGKSTITKALLTALFGNAKSSSAGVMELKSWMGDTLYRIELLFSHDGQKYQLVRDFEAKQQELTNLSTGERWVDKKRIDERMTDIIGFTKAAVFTGTAVVQQEELAKLCQAREEISNLLEAKVSGSGYVDVRNVIKQLKARIAALRKAGVKDPGIIAIEKLKLQELGNRRNDIVQALAYFDEAIIGKSRCEELLPLKQKDSESKKKALAGAAKYKQRYEQLHQEEKNLHAAQQQLNDLQRYMKEMGETQAALELLKDHLVEAEKNLNIHEECKALNETIRKLENNIKEKQKKLEQINHATDDIKNIGQQLAVNGTVDEKIVNLARKLKTEFEVYSRRKEGQGFRVRVRPEKEIQFTLTCDDETTSLPEDFIDFTVDAQSRAELAVPGVINIAVENKDLSAEENLTQLRETTQELQAILVRNNCQSVKELTAKFNQGQALTRQKEVAEQVYIGLLQGQTLEDYIIELQQAVELKDNIRKQISYLQVDPADDETHQHLKATVEQLRIQLAELNSKCNKATGAIEALPALEELEGRCQQHIHAIRIAEDALEDVKPFECTPEEYVLMEDAQKVCEKEIRELETRLELYQRTVNQQKYGEEDLAKVEEVIADTVRRITGHEKQLKVLEYIVEGLEQARSRTVEVISRTITDEVGRKIAHITGGKYTKVRRKEGELSFEMFSPVKKDWLDSEGELSTGTRDQLYLTARLAVLQAISGKENLPVIFDETFVSFDHQRRQRTFDLLRERNNNQFIITTCHDHYDTAADHIITL